MPANALDGVMPLSTQEQIIPAHNEHEEEVIGVTEAPSLYTSQWQRYATILCIRYTAYINVCTCIYRTRGGSSTSI